MVMTDPTPSPSGRTIVGTAFTGTGGAMAGLHLWDRESFGVVFGLVLLGIGLYLSITARKRDRDRTSSAE
jgi:hypothetical protein